MDLTKYKKGIFLGPAGLQLSWRGESSIYNTGYWIEVNTKELYVFPESIIRTFQPLEGCKRFVSIY